MTPVEWVYLAFMIVMVAYTLTNQPTAPPPPQAGQLSIPTTAEGTPVPVTFGTVLYSQTQVMDTFGARTKSIKSRGGK